MVWPSTSPRDPAPSITLPCRSSVQESGEGPDAGWGANHQHRVVGLEAEVGGGRREGRLVPQHGHDGDAGAGAGLGVGDCAAGVRRAFLDGQPGDRQALDLLLELD
jgi:hypothetical protein